MSEYVFHGSHTAGLTCLQALSPLHNAPETRVVYLTGSRAYSLFYIWDAQHNLTARKHITCGLRNGFVHYQEQFPGQLRTFYEGVSGWVYSIARGADFGQVEGREEMWYCPHDAPIVRAEYIPDVYAAIQALQQCGLVQVSQADEPFRRELNRHLAEQIRQRALPETPDAPDALFYARFFPDAWALATWPQGSAD